MFGPGDEMEPMLPHVTASSWWISPSGWLSNSWVSFSICHWFHQYHTPHRGVNRGCLKQRATETRFHQATGWPTDLQCPHAMKTPRNHRLQVGSDVFLYIWTLAAIAIISTLVVFTCNQRSSKQTSLGTGQIPQDPWYWSWSGLQYSLLYLPLFWGTQFTQCLC